jgi:3-oxosteroid 1-dehydrogenase
VTPGSTPERRAAFLEEAPKTVALMERHGIKFQHVNGYADYHHNDYPGGSPNGWSLIAAPYDLRRLGPWADKLRSKGEAPPVSMADLSHLMHKGRTVKSLAAMARVGWRIVQNKLGRRVVGMGRAMQGRILEAALDRSIPIWLDSEVTGFVVDDGRVTGVKVLRDGKEVRVGARRGVLIDAGGFAHNAEMRAKYQPRGVRLDFSMANPGDTGDVILSAMKLGAAVDVMDLSWWVPVSLTPEGVHMIHSSDIAKPHTVVVDNQGRRFVNEATSYVEFGLKLIERSERDLTKPFWFIFDHEYVRKYRFGGFDPEPLLSRFGLSRQEDKFPASWFSSGYLKKAYSLEELARICDLPADQLLATIERLNGFAPTGVDEDFGRGRGAYHRWIGDSRQKPNTNLGIIAKPPFYAVRIMPGDVGTAGGLVTDAAARVLDKAGAPLPGLYATGNATAPVVGRSYPGAGASIGASMVFGVLAARHAMGANG